ncbi:22245_t:CDS:2 [Racocetra persica]|uniref:22245_t:CDS:1 n=1 Tax=Racocetra persica TaxID=160502 RepID=A0ACA9L9Z3_9GLOM|nr:22245_t:CDS:2 [Racocetra persica]
MVALLAMTQYPSEDVEKRGGAKARWDPTDPPPEEPPRSPALARPGAGKKNLILLPGLKGGGGAGGPLEAPQFTDIPRRYISRYLKEATL